MFRLTVLISLLSGWVGYVLSVHAEIPLPTGGALELSPGGSIVLTAVALFAITLVIGAVRRRFGFDQPRKAHVHPDGDPAGCCGV
jgi:ABC-type Mn2+/Zn2+ transport system permease subunit